MSDEEVVREALDRLEFDFAHGDDPFELEPIRWPTEATRDAALEALSRILSDRDSLRERLGAHHVGDLTDGGHCAMCDAAARKARDE